MTNGPIQSHNLPQALTFDDVLLKPGYSDFRRDEITIESKLTKKITLKTPLVAAPMDTVTESELAIALAQEGGIGIIHRNLTTQMQAAEVKKVKDLGLLVGAAIGASSGYEERIAALAEVGVDVVIIDTAHGYVKYVIDAVKNIKQKYPQVEVIAGNIATYEGAQALIEAGADGLRVGMGPGAICTTRIVSGMGVPQITAIWETVRAAKSAGVPVMADGGIKYSGDMVKALAAGASNVMMGSYFASCVESPGQKVELSGDEVPARFRHMLKDGVEKYMFKMYRGMGSVGAMQKGAEVKSEEEYHGKNYKDKVMVAEGVEGLVPVKGTVKELVDQAIGGIKSGLYYVGVKNVEQLQQEVQFMQITHASLTESHPHDLIITNAGKNY